MSFITTTESIFSQYVPRSVPSGTVDVKNTEVLVLCVGLLGRDGFTRREERAAMKFVGDGPYKAQLSVSSVFVVLHAPAVRLVEMPNRGSFVKKW